MNMKNIVCHSGARPESSPRHCESRIRAVAISNQPTLIICGTTSSGKSAYAFKLAKEYKKEVNILSVDSRQFYKDIPIVSGQDDPSELPSNVTLFGQGFLEADQVSNISDFQKYANQIIIKTQSENKKLIIVGGSGLYLKAITESLSNTKVPPDAIFRKEAESYSVSTLQNILKNLNLSLFNSLNNSDINNPRRLIRHIEISQSPKMSQKSTIYHLPSTTYSWLGLRKSPETLLQSIRERVVLRLKNGAIEEVETLQKKYPNQSLPIYSTLGVSQIQKYLCQEITKEELIKKWTIDDNNYAKRQMVWFKKQPQIVWYD